ncbi:hypothetical protein AV530_014811 [Patagioenas fasciata monilis]|uniref:Uncharacterized protein n=1 Tax=Patagioenas fasciata monilis TaxID=372326 RepID=A0A1V4L1Z0_PATFA|nr:hypothetical protein AV530_014811 [Patagioenas fasciata monilis]
MIRFKCALIIFWMQTDVTTPRSGLLTKLLSHLKSLKFLKEAPATGEKTSRKIYEQCCKRKQRSVILQAFQEREKEYH